MYQNQNQNDIYCQIGLHLPGICSGVKVHTVNIKTYKHSKYYTNTISTTIQKAGQECKSECAMCSVQCSVMVPSQKCKLPLPRALTQPYTMTDPGFWTLVLFFFGPEHTPSISSIKDLH